MMQLTTVTVTNGNLRSLSFYIQSFSLTECIGIVGVRKYLGCLSAVCLCVCLCVCVCVCSRQYGETAGPISMKLSKNDPL